MISEYLRELQKEAVSGFAIDSFPQNEKPVMRIMVDFDRTIHKYSQGWKDGSIYDDPVDGAKEALEYLKNKGFEIVIFSSRVSPQTAHENGSDVETEIKKISSWLKLHKIPFDKITAEKLNADAYIDDKAIWIKNDWKSVLKRLENLKLK